MELGPIGMWGAGLGLSTRDTVDLVRRGEDWGYSAIWIPEAVGRDPFAMIGYLLARTEKMIFATGI